MATPGQDSRERKARAGLVAGSILLTLLLAEVALRAFPNWFIYASMRNVVQRECTRPDPVVGFVNRENYRGEFTNREFRTAVSINGKGLRDLDYPYARVPGRPRCLFLGDSFVFGWGVEAAQSVSKIVEGKLQGPEVINAGCSGWSTKQELLFLEQEGIRYSPDVVLLFFCENDPDENGLRYAFVQGKLTYAGAPQSRSSQAGRWLAKHSAVWNLLREAFGAPIEEIPIGEPASLWEREEEYLSAFRVFCASHGASSAIVYVPHKNRSGLPRRGSYFSALRSFCEREGEPFVDLVPAMADEKVPAYFRFDDHWTRHGHEVAARVVTRFLRDSGWLDPHRARAAGQEGP